MSRRLELPPSLADKAQGLAETSHGATQATLLLADGRRVPEVTLAWGHQIVRVGARAVSSAEDLDFAVDDVVDVVLEAHV